MIRLTTSYNHQLRPWHIVYVDSRSPYTIVTVVDQRAVMVKPGAWRRNRIKRTRGVWQRFERRIA